MKNCDNCSRFFESGETILNQKSNELGNNLILDFCNKECLQSSIKKYPFINAFKFEEEQFVDNNTVNIKEIMIYIVTNFYEIIFENGEPKKSLQIIKEYIDLKNTVPEQITPLQIEYVNFMRDKGFINMKLYL